jgi:hypothetical protein
MFNQVQVKIGNMRKITRTKRPAAEVYFCGVLYCSECGGKYSSKWGYLKERNEDGRKTAKHPNYRCTTSMKGGCAGTSCISHAKLEQAFEAYISRVENFSESRDAPADIEYGEFDRERERSAIVADLSRLEQKAAELRALFVASEIDFSEYQHMAKLSQQQRGELETRLAMLDERDAQAKRMSAAEIADNLRSNWQTLDNAGRLRFVQQFIKRLEVHSVAHNGGRLRDVIIDGLVFNEF